MRIIIYSKRITTIREHEDILKCKICNYTFLESTIAVWTCYPQPNYGSGKARPRTEED